MHTYVHKLVIFSFSVLLSAPFLTCYNKILLKTTGKPLNKQTNQIKSKLLLLVITGLHHSLLPSNTEVIKAVFYTDPAVTTQYQTAVRSGSQRCISNCNQNSEILPEQSP